jgi:mono/diheme cytochrome c family protein
MRNLILIAIAISASAAVADDSLKIFDQRIRPILAAKHPSSCSECHLSGVDLKDFIRDSEPETFASLVAGGLVDVKKPAESKLLKFIERKPEKPSLISEKVRGEEAEAFRAWIMAAVKDSKLLASAREGGDDPLKVPVEVIRHTRSDRVLQSFMENVWVEAGRCAACHSPEKNAEKVKEHGPKVSWITPRDPQATLNHLLEAGLIDVDEPENSLLLLKPLNKVKHGGGQKMASGDRSHKQFRRFLTDYAASAKGEYQKPSQLPKPDGEVSAMTDVWLKLTDVPEKFDQQLLQVDLYRAEGSGWSKQRVATSDRLVFGKGKLWQHSLVLVAERGSEQAKANERSPLLPAGKYLVKIYVDCSGKLANDADATLDASDLVGEIEVTSEWKPGYGAMTVAKFPTLR